MPIIIIIIIIVIIIMDVAGEMINYNDKDNDNKKARWQR